MAVYQAESMPRVAREDMNAVHAEEIEMVNRIGELIEAVEQGAEPAPLHEALDAWLAHARAHFDNEHRIMEETGFPAYPVHRAEHERVLAQLEEVVRRYEENGELALLRQFVFEIWPGWFDNHVNTMDFATAHFAEMAARGGPPV